MDRIAPLIIAVALGAALAMGAVGCATAEPADVDEAEPVSYAPPEFRTCLSDADCVEGFACADGRCLSVDTGYVQTTHVCQSDDACFDGGVCTNSVCATPVWDCATDTDCDFGEYCRAGMCFDDGRPGRVCDPIASCGPRN